LSNQISNLILFYLIATPLLVGNRLTANIFGHSFRL